jgi:hypothetical protein
MAAETLTIRTASSTEVVKIASVGPQGPKGDKGDPGDVAGLPLSTLGDTLYRGAAANERLAIGTAGQVLKVSSGGIPEWGAESGAVSSVAGRTGAVTLAVADVSGAVASTDSRLSDSRTPTLHGSTHHTGGTDAIAAHQINGQTIFSVASANYSDDQTLPANRARQIIISNSNAGGITVTLPTQAEGTLLGDTYVIVSGSTMSGPITVRSVANLSPLVYNTHVTITATGQQYRLRSGGGSGGSWALIPVDTHTHTGSQVTVGTTANLPLITGTNGVVEAGSFSNVAGSFCEGDDARLSDDRDPNLHAASHLAGTPAVAASYTGIGDSETFSEEVTITADTAGTAGNNITLTFDGVDDVDTVLAAWNAANPSNQATLDSGDGAQVPDDGDSLTLSGGVAAIVGGSDPFANINQDLGTTNSPTFAGLELNSPSNGELLRIEGNGSGDVGFAVYNTTGNQANSFYFNQNNSFIGIGVGASRNYIQSSQPVDVGAELAVAGPIDITGASASTHKATTRTNLGAAASGSITTSGLTQSTARILGRTTASTGAVEEIQIGSGLSLSAGELSATGGSGGSSIMQSIAVGFVLN